MSSDASRPDLRLAWAIVVGLTLWRLTALAFDRTDLFVDEAQYWLWGQNLDWGYFSKPPMIAWLSRAVTGLAGSSDIFWVRFPAPLLHSAAAGLTGLAAARIFDARTGAWAAIVYVTTPFATLGSWQFSTDTVMLPFYAAALLSYVRLTTARSLVWATLFGAATGLGFLSKYAMIYLPLMIVLAALFTPSARIAWRDAALAAAVALIVAAPNLIWNLANGGTTIKHVAEGNARVGDTDLSLARGAEFFLSQFAVFGPVLFALCLAALWRALRRRAAAETVWLLSLSLPVVFLMTFQAIRAQAHANWAVTGFVAGSVLAAFLLLRDAPRLRWPSTALHLAFAIGFPFLFIFPEAIRLSDGRFAADRYLGRSALAQDIAETAYSQGLDTIVANDRGILADLFYTLRDTGLALHARPLSGAPRHYYDDTFALAAGFNGSLIYVTMGDDPPCREGRSLTPITPDSGAYRGKIVHLYRIDAACISDAKKP